MQSIYCVIANSYSITRQYITYTVIINKLYVDYIGKKRTGLTNYFVKCSKNLQQKEYKKAMFCNSSKKNY